MIKNTTELIIKSGKRTRGASVAWRQATAARQVSTSAPDKTHQCLARKQQASLQHQNQTDESNQARELQDESKKYAARLERLDLWHSLDTIKRLGYRLASLDPLGLCEPSKLEDLTWSHGLIERLRHNQSIVPTEGLLETKQPVMAIQEIANTIWNIYTDDCGLEFGHLSSQQEIDWLTSEWEKLNESFHLNSVDELNLAKLLLECETFDHFMAAKFATTKRYSCEGAESMLVVFDEIFRLCQTNRAAEDPLLSELRAIDHVIIGMPHRGRLNVLTCLLDFEPAAIFNKARGGVELDAWMAKGDVLSHLSTNVRFVYGFKRQPKSFSGDKPTPLNVSLLPNPSHLELVAPVVAGVARGRAHNLLHGYSSSPKFGARPSEGASCPEGQLDMNGNQYRHHFEKILPIQVHGDASVSGQGIVQETLQMANLNRFTVGGSLHLVVNNQIGYTTDQSSGRSTRNCTDIFKLIEAPILHVNGENICQLIKATRLALCYRHRFNKDIAINLVCYRKHGHNELDDPTFTQPKMYDSIKQRGLRSIPQIYCDKIGLEATKRDQIVTGFKSELASSYNKLNEFVPDNDNYRNFSLATEIHRDSLFNWPTGYELDKLRQIGLDSVQTPDLFEIHPTLKRSLVDDRRTKLDTSTNKPLEECQIDWATAEIMAFGSLLHDNQTIRLVGQDVERGTFSTRHAVLIDRRTGSPYVPLNRMSEHVNKARLEVANSVLSEEAALAFEFGYSIETCSLAIWEAQFGDFFNTAQSVVDTLISSSESKWLRQSALTLLLPHGLDGAGPEHSSARIERFLQLSSSSSTDIDTEAKCNWSICNPTLPSQYFHLLRRQVLRPFRKPLIVMSPKSLFRHEHCKSQLAAFGPSTSFKPVLDDPDMTLASAANKVDTIVLCSGKIYYELRAVKQRLDMANVAVLRLEELCPFPVSAISRLLTRYTNVNKANKIIWLQEEHKNQGCYSFVDARLRNLLGVSPTYLGRAESDLPAAGSGATHRAELDRLLADFGSLRGC